MGKLIAFENVTLDGYFTGVNGDLSWAHQDKTDSEFNAFIAQNAKSDGVLLFGRKTYDMMAGYWPSPMAAKNDPAMAKSMNDRAKIVFSKTIGDASWNNTRLVKTDMLTEIRALKASGPDMAILGSGSLVAQLAEARLIDEYQLAVNPVAIGTGRSLFNGLTRKLDLKLSTSRAFANGIVFISYVAT